VSKRLKLEGGRELGVDFFLQREGNGGAQHRRPRHGDH
jgi:hypothetical protein